MNPSRLLSFRNLEKAELKLLWESGLNVPMLDPAKNTLMTGIKEEFEKEKTLRWQFLT